MSGTIARIMLVTFTLMTLMVETGSAEGIPSATVVVSCTIPEVPGLNAPLREETNQRQLSEETRDKTIVTASDESAVPQTQQEEEITEDTSNYNTVLKTVYRK